LAWTAEFWELLSTATENTWGTPDGSGVEFCTPSLIGDESAWVWYAHYWRSAASPSSALALLRVNTQIDIRPVLCTVRVPTLVLHRTDEVWVNINYGRYTAEKIPGATLVELPGTVMFYRHRPVNRAGQRARRSSMASATRRSRRDG
jgi:pimeloyl-ACP methyl ester carboxylesterase